MDSRYSTPEIHHFSLIGLGLGLVMPNSLGVVGPFTISIELLWHPGYVVGR